jgi:hypothetical protein
VELQLRSYALFVFHEYDVDEIGLKYEDLRRQSSMAAVMAEGNLVDVRDETVIPNPPFSATGAAIIRYAARLGGTGRRPGIHKSGSHTEGPVHDAARPCRNGAAGAARS